MAIVKYIYRVLKYRFLFKIDKFVPRTINIKKKSMYQQDGANCWIFSVLNNIYLNTGIEVDPFLAKEYISRYGLNVDTIGNDTEKSSVIMCKYLESYNLRTYTLDVLQDTALFGKLLKNGYAFVYSRDCHDNVLQDIKDNNEINEIIRSKGYRHAVNLCFLKGKLTEYGSWGNYNIYNNFTYGSTDVFIKSVKAGAINSKVLFIDFKQNGGK